MPAFGPQTPMAPTPARVARQERFEALVRRRPHHPYARLGLSCDDVASDATRALDALSSTPQEAPGLILGPPAHHVSEAGTVTVGDGGLPSTLLPPDALSRPLVLTHLPGTSPFPPAQVAALLAHQLGRPSDAVQVAPIEGDLPPHLAPAALARLLDDGPQAHPALLARFAEASRAWPEGAVALVAPIWGQRVEVAAAWRRALEEATGATVAETLGLDMPVHGLRLWRWLHRQVEAAGVSLVHGRVERLAVTLEGGRATAAEATFGGQTRRFELDGGLVLATGRFLGGGVRSEPPLTEALLGLPLLRDGQLIDNPALHPTSLGGARPWGDSPLMRLGVAIDEAGRPLGDDGRLWATNALAAGRLIGGTHTALDGCAQGVALVTGWRAGLAAAQGGA